MRIVPLHLLMSLAEPLIERVERYTKTWAKHWLQNASSLQLSLLYGSESTVTLNNN